MVYTTKAHGPVYRTNKNHRLTVSCQCLASYEKHVRTKGGGEFYPPMQPLPGETLQRTYNRPENHWVEFMPADRILEPR